MKLWLDDLRNPPDSSWHWVKNPLEAMGILIWLSVHHEEHLTAISFDHDLGCTYCGQEITGYNVACALERLVYDGLILTVPEWNVHSANPPGAERIEAAMRSAEKLQHYH